MMAQGTIDDPLTLGEAMTSNRIQPGHTVWLRGGTYTLTDQFFVTLQGTAEKPITIRPYTNEYVRIDMASYNLDVNGQYLVFLDIDEVFSSSDSATRPCWFDFHCAGGKWIGGLFHNIRNVGFWKSATNGQFLDAVLHDVGDLPDDDGATGHCFYTQSNDTHIIHRCVVGPANSAESGAPSIHGTALEAHRGFDIRDCVFFNGVPRFGYGGPRLENCTIQNNMMFVSSEPVYIYPCEPKNSRVVFRGNVFADTGPKLMSVQAFEFTNNVIYSERNRQIQYLQNVLDPVSVAIDNNAYYGPMSFGVDTSAFPFAQWQQQTGFDADSFYSANPPARIVKVVCCTDSLRRAGFIAVLDYTEPKSVTVDVTALALETGTTYRVRNAYDPLNDYADVVYDDRDLVLDMANRTQSTPTGWHEPTKPMNRVFGVWIIDRTEHLA